MQIFSDVIANQEYIFMFYVFHCLSLSILSNELSAVRLLVPH